MKKGILILTTLAFAACTKTPLPAEPTVYEDALLILNEGAFTGGTATIDAVGGHSDTAVQSAFSTENGFALGSQHQFQYKNQIVLPLKMTLKQKVRHKKKSHLL